MKYIYWIFHIIIYFISFILLWVVANLIFPILFGFLVLILGFNLTGFDPVASAVRSTQGSLREYLILELAPIAIASYLAVKVLDILKIKYNEKAILYGFGTLAFGFLIYSLFLMIPVTELAGFTLLDYLIQIATPVTAVTVLYFTLKEEN